MKVTKTAILKELKGMWNNTKVIHGVNVAYVAWRQKQGEFMSWMIIEDNETFEEAKQSDFTPIEHFHTQRELATAIYNVIQN